MADQFDELRNLLGPKIGDEIEALAKRQREKLEAEGISGIICAPDGSVTPHGNPPAGMVAALDQAWAASRAGRADRPQAAAEARCIAPPMGCGLPVDTRFRDDLGPEYAGLPGGFRNEKSRIEYGISGWCQACQDKMFAPPAGLGIEEIHELERDEDMFRCGECGEYREATYVDVGIGRGPRYEVCCPVWDEAYVAPPRCTEVPGCKLGEGHFHHHAVVGLHKPLCWVCHGYNQSSNPDQPFRRCTCKES